MIKFVAELQSGSGNLYGFGMTEANLNRMQYNSEPIFFDFGYAAYPKLFGLIVYFDQFDTPEDIAKNLDLVKPTCLPFFSAEHGVTPETLRFFPIAKTVMQRFRAVPFWGFDTQIEITQPGDKQLFFAGRDEQEIERYFQQTGLISPQKTKRTYKGFGRQD